MRGLQIFASVALLTTSATALAQATPAAGSPPPAAVPAAGKDANATDPNKLVCRTVEITGSRLGKKRICHTAEEWAEQRALDRQQIERQQANRYKGNSLE